MAVLFVCCVLCFLAILLAVAVLAACLPKNSTSFSLNFRDEEHNKTQGPKKSQEQNRSLDCHKDPAYVLSVENWQAQGVDAKFSQWWKNTSSNKSHGPLVNELATQFGDHVIGFDCGIKKYSTCPIPGCNGYDPWPFLTINSIAHLNTYFNSMYDGVTTGQLDFDNLANNISLTFFPTKDFSFSLGDASFWIIAIINIISTIPLVIPAKLGAIGLSGIGQFAVAGVQQLTSALEPETPQDVKIAQLLSYTGTASIKARTTIENWAKKTFDGLPDEAGATILNYTQGGAYIGTSLPTNEEIETFYRKQLVSRIINQLWTNNQRYYITFSATKDSNIATGPDEGRYYSKEDGGVYYLYGYYQTNAGKAGHVDAPGNLGILAAPPYNISGNDITKAAARAWRQGGLNYTNEMANKRIMAAISSKGALTPFKDGAGWEGTWTLPVCDQGAHPEWNSKWGKGGGKRKFDWMPCCCGKDCKDTKAFLTAAGFIGSKPLADGCRDQFKLAGIDCWGTNLGFNKKC